MTTKLTRVFIFSFDYSRQYTFFFFFNDTATTEIYTLSLHDALPISIKVLELHHHGIRVGPTEADADRARTFYQDVLGRSEEHTSELQSQSNLVCRLLLEKKKKTKLKERSSATP